MKTLVLIVSLFFAETIFAKPTFISRFCYPKKEVPEFLQIKFEENGIKFTNKSKSPLTFFSLAPEEVLFPRHLPPNQMPVAVYVNSKRFQVTKLGMKKVKMEGNPLSNDFSDVEAKNLVNCWLCGETWGIIRNGIPLTQNEIRNFFEVPMNYYVGDEYIQNSVRIYFSGINSIKASKVETARPLPEGFKINLSPETNLVRHKVYDLLTFNYSGSVPVTFVKEFKERQPDQADILNKHIPLLVFEKNTCATLMPETYEVVSRATDKKSYDDIVLRGKKIIKYNPNSKVDESVLESIKTMDIYDLFPLGHIFNGNGRIEASCGFNWKNAHYDFFGMPKRFLSQPDEDSLGLPPDDIFEMQIRHDKTERKFHLIRRYFVNHLPSKKTKVLYPIYDWKLRDLECVFPGEDYSVENEDKFL